MGVFDTVIDVPLACTHCGFEGRWEVQFRCAESWQRTVRIGEPLTFCKEVTQNPSVTFAFAGYVATRCTHCNDEPERYVDVIVRDNRLVEVRPDCGIAGPGLDTPAVVNDPVVSEPNSSAS